MYLFNFHHVEPVITHASRKHISITPEGLRRCIRLMRWLGLEVVSLKEVIAQGGPQTMDGNKVALTFDDGYENFYQYAAPVLQSERCPATVFVLAGKFGSTNDWDQGDLPETQRDRLMTQEQVRALSRFDMISVGSHGLSHQDYSQLDEAELQKEIEQSYAILSSEAPACFVPVMAYPWGRYSETTLQCMAQSAYRFGLTTQKGRWEAASAAFEVPRYSFYYRDGNPLVVLAKLCKIRVSC